jgi:uncharacterized integral membrane protein
MALTLILGFVLGAASLLFIIQNTAVVGLSFLHWQFETSIAMLVLMAILVGIVLTLLFILPGAIGDSFRMRKLRKHNESLANEAEVQRQAAHEATVRLADAQTPHPDVIDLSE